jgi:hypothetical protein
LGYEDGMSEVPSPSRCHLFTWALSDIVSALLEAGFLLEVFREYPWSNGCVFGERMRELPGRRFLPPADVPRVPMMYGISVLRP